MRNIKSFKSFNESDGSYQLPNDVENWLEDNRSEIEEYISSLSEEDVLEIDRECNSIDIKDLKEIEKQNESLNIGSSLRKLIKYFYNKYKADKGIKGARSFLVFAAALMMFLSSCTVYVGSSNGFRGNKGYKSSRKHKTSTNNFRCRSTPQVINAATGM